LNISSNIARSTLFQVVIFLIGLAGVLFWQRGNIADLYLSGDINPVGWMLNAVIILLFLLGLFRIIALLLHYSREHVVLAGFQEALARNGGVLKYLGAKPLHPRALCKQYFDITWRVRHRGIALHCAGRCL